jgi:hypothetical protein
MCIGIEFFVDAELRTVYFDSKDPALPLRGRGGVIRFCRWGARSPEYFAPDNVSGWGSKFPETGWLPLDEIRAGKWARFEPRPARIVATRFLVLDEWRLPQYFVVPPRNFIQGLVATIAPYQRVYVVTVPPPADAADLWPAWPRLVRGKL